jgi:branched-chain amino acid transport system substrate-binding protein
MSRSTVYRAVVVGAIAPLALTACGGSAKGGTSHAAGSDSGTAIVLGASLSLTGPLGQFGLALQAGYKQQISEVNAAGGLDVGGTKRQVTLTVLDNRSDPNTATGQIRELVLKDNAAALLGACTPPIVVPEALAAEQQKIPYVSSCNPVHAFQAGNAAGWNYAWDLFFDESDQATAVAKGLAMAAGNKKVALFTDTEPDGVAERPLYKQALTAAGLQVVGDYTFPVGTTDFSSFVNDAKGKGAQLVAGQMVPPDGIALWKQMKALSFQPTAAFVAKAAAGNSWTKALGPIAEGTLSDAFWSPGTGAANSQALMSTLGTRFPGNMSDLNIAVLGYTVSAIVTDGIKAAGSTDPVKLNTAIGKINADYPLGHIAFGPKHTAVTPFLLTQWQNDDTVLIVPSTPGATLEQPAKGLQ